MYYDAKQIEILKEANYLLNKNGLNSYDLYTYLGNKENEVNE